MKDQNKTHGVSKLASTFFFLADIPIENQF